MGYPTVEKFDKVFIQRTKEILDGNFSDYDFTLLINCLMGLLVLPNERKSKHFRREHLNQTIDTFPEPIRNIFVENQVVYYQDEDQKEKQMSKCAFFTNKGKKKSASPVPLSELLGKLRNAIAHFNIKPTKSSDDYKWEGIIVKNIFFNNELKKSFTTMKLYLSKDEIKELVAFIIKRYEQ